MGDPVQDAPAAFRVGDPETVDLRQQHPIIANNMSANESFVTINLVKWDTMLTNGLIYEQNALREDVNLE